MMIVSISRLTGSGMWVLDFNNGAWLAVDAESAEKALDAVRERGYIVSDRVRIED